MKKVLSLALVLCMAIACFAFAPTSAESYWGNLLTYTEDNSTIYDTVPWGQSGDGVIGTWAYPDSTYGVQDNYPEGWQQGAVSNWATLTTDASEILPGENRFGDAKGIKLDFSKMPSWEETGNSYSADWGTYLNVYTGNCEKDKTYTFFFAIKADKAPAADTSVTVLNRGGWGAGTLTGAETKVDITTDWQLVKWTFTCAGDANMYCFKIIFHQAVAQEINVLVDGFAMVEGDGADITGVDFYANNFVDPADNDGDHIYNWEDTDINGDGVPNEFDRDMDGDKIKNVWDRDMDSDNINNKVDSTPFGGVVGSEHGWDHVA